MKFGCCFDLDDDKILQLRQAGADYVELNFSALAQKTAVQTESRARQLKAAGLPCYAMNVLFPGCLPLTGEQVDYTAIDSYLRDAFEKAVLLAPKRLVFGSGQAKMVPSGFPKEEAFTQLVTLCREHLAPLAEQYGLLCCIEPLNRGECNIINTCAEGMELVRRTNSPSIRLLVDLYHFDLEKEKLSSLQNYRGFLEHAHIASAKNSREIPHEGDGEDYSAFFKALQAVGYDGSLSLEGSISGDPLRDITDSLSYLRAVWNAAVHRENT